VPAGEDLCMRLMPASAGGRPRASGALLVLCLLLAAALLAPAGAQPVPPGGLAEVVRELPGSAAGTTGEGADVQLHPVPVASAPTYADWRWADARTAPIHPGVRTVVGEVQCTSNFVFVQVQRVSGVDHLVDVLLGAAGHCATTTSEADECRDRAHPIGTPVAVEGATRPAAVAYNATLTMQRVGERDEGTCMHNDFALFRLHRDDWGRVNPSLPVYGGPTGVASGAPAVGSQVFSWGNSDLRMGVDQTNPKRGAALGTGAGGWNHDVVTATPAIPGDSGSGFLDAGGRALGVLSTIELAPVAGSNNLTDLRLAVRYAAVVEPAMRALRLEPGTQPFDSESAAAR
jgi:hypothetical protein